MTVSPVVWDTAASAWKTIAGSAVSDSSTNVFTNKTFNDQVTIERSGANDAVLRTQATGNAVPRLNLLAQGYFEWSNGTDPADVSLARNAPGAVAVTGRLFVSNATSDAGSVATVDGTQTLTGKKATLAAGGSSAGAAPLKFTSGTNLTTAEAGAVEYDGNIFYLSSAASTRQVNDAEQFITLTSTRTFTNNTSLQAIFTAPPNGAVTLVGSTTYFFECQFTVTGLSTSAHTLGFGFGGTATITRQSWHATAMQAAAIGTPGTCQISYQTATAAITSSGTTANQVVARITGKLVIGTGGTLIPSAQQNTNSAAAIVGNDSYFRIWPVGTNTVQSVGNWS